MDDREVNIDIVFRNGFKDYEVLPPPDLWDNIRPVIQKRQRPYILFRSAAIIAVALSLSFLAYRWSKEFSSGQEEMIQAQNTESAIAPSLFDEISPPGIDNRSNPVLLFDASHSANKPDMTIASGGNFTIRSIENPSVSAYQTPNNASFADKSELRMIGKPVVNHLDANKGALPLVPENIEQNKPGKWSLTALISPAYYGRLSKGNNEALAQVMTSEQPVVSYSGGVGLSYRINRRFSIQSGLYYSSIGQELSGISSYSGFEKLYNAKGNRNFDILTANGTVYANNADVFLLDSKSGDRILTRYTSDVIDPVKAELAYIDNSLRQNFSYLELPVIFRYKIVDKTLDFNVIGGLSSNLLVNNTVSADNNGGRYQVGKTEGLNLVTFSSSLGMGMEYNFSGNLSLNLEPTFRYYLNPFGTFPGIKTHPFSFGVFSGLSYRF